MSYVHMSVSFAVCLLVCSEDLLKDSFVVISDEGDGHQSWSERPRSSVKFDVDDTVDERHAKVCLVSTLSEQQPEVKLRALWGLSG